MYLPEKYVMFEPDEVKNVQYSTEMHILKVMAERVVTKSGLQCLQLQQIASDKEPSHNQWYYREDGSEQCNHFDLPENFHQKLCEVF